MHASEPGLCRIFTGRKSNSIIVPELFLLPGNFCSTAGCNSHDPVLVLPELSLNMHSRLVFALSSYSPPAKPSYNAGHQRVLAGTIDLDHLGMVVTITNGLAALAVPLYYTVDAQRAYQKAAYRSVDLITPTHLVK